ncbi:MAG: Wzy polymerase domain-containing protein [Burkholderiaceae bacterium]|nr:Wzy polymerase domain-containing protein [Burkholderiaceae bacterium]
MPLIVSLLIGVFVCLRIFVAFDQTSIRLAIPVAYFIVFLMAVWFGGSFKTRIDARSTMYLCIALAHLSAAFISVGMQTVQASGLPHGTWLMEIAHDAQTPIRPYANVAQPNQLALLLCFGLASIWWLYHQYRLNKLAAFLLAVTLIWGIVLTQSRIAWIILPLFALLAMTKIEGQRRISKFTLISLLLLYVVLVLSLPDIGKWMGFSTGTVLERVGGRSERTVLLKQAWRMAAEHPWFGVGWGRFGAEQVKIAADFSSSTYAEHSHNIVMNFAAELGWPFTVLFFSALVWWFVQTCVLPKASLDVRFATFCFIAVGVHSMVEFPLWYAFVLIPIGVLMGMVHQARWPNEGVIGGITIPRGGVISVRVAGLLVLALVTWDYQRVVKGFAVLRNGSNITATERLALQAPRYTLFGDYFDYFTVYKLLPREGMSAEEIQFVEKMSQRFGFVHVLNKMAEVYVLNGQTSKAARSMLTLQRLHPGAYPEYFDYWKSMAMVDPRYRAVFETMPKRDAP